MQLGQHEQERDGQDQISGSVDRVGEVNEPLHIAGIWSIS